MNNTITKLGEEKVWKLILSFFTTTFISLILNSIYNLTDTLFISWGVGDLAMSGVAIIAPFVLIQGAISTMIGSGAAALVSLKLGEGNANDAGKITVNAMVIFYSLAITITICGLLFINPLLKIMGANSEIFPYAKDYFTIILIGNIFSTGFSSVMRAEGKNLYSMIMWVTTIIVNIILDAIFILVFRWGVKGAAAATVIGQAVGLILSIVFYAKLSTQKFKGSKIDIKTIMNILKIGLPSLIQMGSMSIIIAVLNFVISKFSGSVSLITFGYISKLILYATTPIMAVAQAMSPVIGFNHGKDSPVRVKEGVRFSMIIAFISAAFLSIVFLSIPQYLMMIFTKDTAVIALGTVALRIAALLLPLMPLPMLIGAKMQAIGNKLWATIFYSANLIFIIIPTILLGKSYGMNGMMWAYVLANACSCMLVAIKLVADRHKRSI